MTISIIVPVYNAEPYIGQCLESILNQEECGERIECIFVDDGTCDNSFSIIQTKLKDYKGSIDFVFIKHQYNKGLSAARNTGIDAANGQYIYFLDADDWLPHNALSKFIDVLKANPNIDFVAGNYYNKRDKCSEPLRKTELTILSNSQLRKGLLNHQDIACTAWNKLIRASLLKDHIFPEGIIFEDNYWAYFFFRDVQNSIAIPDITYIYENEHVNSITNTSKNKEKASLHMKSICVIGNAILDNPYEGLFIDCLFFILGFLVTALRLQLEHKLINSESQQLKSLRRRCIIQSVRNGYWFLGLFIYLLTFPPTCYIFNIRWFRRHFYNICDIGKSIATFLNKTTWILSRKTSSAIGA